MEINSKLGGVYIKLIKRFLLIFLTLILFSSCAPSDENLTVDFNAMDTYCNVTVYDKNDLDNARKVEEIVSGIEGKISKTQPISEIYRLNQNKSTTLSEEVTQLIEKSNEISKLTDGAFDISLGELTELWNINSIDAPPTEIQILHALTKIGYNNIELQNNDITLKNDVSIDLGGVGKGYASELAVDFLKANGVKSAMLSFGGNVGLIGSKSDGSDFSVGVANPEIDKNNIVAVLSLRDTYAVTSGLYQRFFEYENKIYHHILDPKTGYPSDNSLLSMTIISESGTEADALSTALFVMGEDKAIEFYEKKLLEFEFCMITKDKKIKYTVGLADKIRLSENGKNAGYILEVIE